MLIIGTHAVLFEENRNIRDPRAVATMLAKVEKDLNRLRHPDRIIPAQAPGGTKWERNIQYASLIS